MFTVHAPKVLLHNGEFYNACTMKRCLHAEQWISKQMRLIMPIAHVSQLLPYYILLDQNKLVASGYK